MIVSEPAPRPPAFSLASVLRRSRSMSAASLVGSVLSAATSFAVARWLGPTSLGRVQYVLLFYFYATLLRTGTFEGGMRAYVQLTAEGRSEAATRARDVAVTFETVASLLPGLAMIGLAFAMDDPTRRLGFFLAPVAVAVSSLSSYYGGMFIAEQRFREVGATNLVRAAFVPLATLAGVLLFGAKAVFIAPLLGDTIALVSFRLRRPRLLVKPRFDRMTWGPLLRTGFPIGALGVVYWLYRLVGSTTIALSGSASSFGIYAFALGPVAAVAGAIAAVHAVLTPSLWSEMATSSGGRHWIPEAKQVTLALGVVSAVATNLCQAAFLPLVLLVLPGFRASAPILEILSFNIFLLSICAIPSIVLESARVNRQARYLMMWVGLLGINVAANVAAIALGGGSMAVAGNDIWVQSVAVILTFGLAWRHLGGTAAWGSTVAYLGGMAVWCAAVELTMRGTVGANGGHGAMALAVLRLGIVFLFWAPLLLAARRMIASRAPRARPSGSELEDDEIARVVDH